MTKKITKQEQQKQYDEARARYRDRALNEILDFGDNSFQYDQNIHLMYELSTIKQQVADINERFDLRDGREYENTFEDSDVYLEHTEDLICMLQEAFDKVIESLRDETFGAHPEPKNYIDPTPTVLPRPGESITKSLRDLLKSQRDRSQTDSDPDVDPDKLN